MYILSQERSQNVGYTDKAHKVFDKRFSLDEFNWM